MTLFQDAASVRKPVTSERALAAPLAAIVASLVVVLAAVAVMSFVAAGRPTGTIQSNLDSQAFDGWMPAALARIAQQRIEAAQSLEDGWESALVPERTYMSTDGWEKALIQPREAERDAATIHRYLLPADQAAVTGSGLRFAPQPAEATGDSGSQRFVQAD